MLSFLGICKIVFMNTQSELRFKDCAPDPDALNIGFVSIDTPEDLERAELALRLRKIVDKENSQDGSGGKNAKE